MDSNHTLRFPRTAKEAGLYGPIGGDDYDPDSMVAVGVAIGFAFLLGFLLGGSI